MNRHAPGFAKAGSSNPSLSSRTYGAFLLGFASISLMGIGCSAAKHPVTMSDDTPRFVALGNGTVRDNATGLVWTQNSNIAAISDPWGGLTWPEANEFVAEMNSGVRPNMGCTTWRLPTASQLDALIDSFWRSYNRYTAMAATQSSDDLSALRNLTTPFENFAETAYWSSTQAQYLTAAGSAATASPAGSRETDGSHASTAPSSPDPPFAVAVSTSGNAFPLAKTDRKRVWPVCTATVAGAATQRCDSTVAGRSPCSDPS